MVSLSVAPVPPVEGVDAAALLEAAEDAAGVEAAALLPLLLLPQPASRETVMSAARDRDKNFFILVPLFLNICRDKLPCLHIIQDWLSYFKGFSDLFCFSPQVFAGILAKFDFFVLFRALFSNETGFVQKGRPFFAR